MCREQRKERRTNIHLEEAGTDPGWDMGQRLTNSLDFQPNVNGYS